MIMIVITINIYVCVCVYIYIYIYIYVLIAIKCVTCSMAIESFCHAGGSETPRRGACRARQPRRAGRWMAALVLLLLLRIYCFAIINTVTRITITTYY